MPLSYDLINWLAACWVGRVRASKGSAILRIHPGVDLKDIESIRDFIKRLGYTIDSAPPEDTLEQDKTGKVGKIRKVCWLIP